MSPLRIDPTQFSPDTSDMYQNTFAMPLAAEGGTADQVDTPDRSTEVARQMELSLLLAQAEARSRLGRTLRFSH